MGVPSQAYTRRIRRVLVHIDDHLDEELSLDVLAGVSGFSKFHFHRVFRSMVGETLHAYLTRVRVERGAALLVHGKASSVGDAAFACGFKTGAHFSRAFKARYGVPPSRASTLGEVRGHAASERAREWVRRERVASISEVVVREWPACTIASARVVGFEPERLLAGFSEIDAWLESRGIDIAEHIGILRDDPDLVALDSFRYEVGAVVPRGTIGSGAVSVGELPRRPVATLHVSGSLLDVVSAWIRLFDEWLPTSRYEPDDAPGLERILVDPREGGWGGIEVELNLPLVPLRVV